MAIRIDQGRHRPALASLGDVRPLTRPARAGVSAFVVTAGATVALAVADGGYYPPSWGWAGLAARAVAAAALVRRRLPESRREWLMLTFAVGLLGWVAAAATRSGLATAAVPELERDALYLAVLWAALAALRRATV